MSRRECEIQLSLQLPAGSETVSSVLEGTLLHLLATPCVYQKLKDEISNAIHNGVISDPITNEEAKKLPYLQVMFGQALVSRNQGRSTNFVQAIIYEGLRIMPPALNGFPKQVPPEGDTIQGVFVPGGTEIFINIWNMARNEDIFGPDVETFRPERFLESSEEGRARMMKIVDLVFGHGRWQCPGKLLALIELNKIFVQVSRKLLIHWPFVIR